MDRFTSIEVSDACEMALAVNGGDWGTDYTEAQKIGWCLKVRWARRRYSSSF